MGASLGPDDHDSASLVTAVQRLAILVVYLVRDDTELDLLQLHLERIARHTHTPYSLYAAVNRATPRAREMLASTPNVIVCDIAESDQRGSREHAYYLDGLAVRALDGGASHIVTLDVDSFPIDDGWVDVLATTAPSDSGVAGILRAENGDVALPHPSCTLIRRDFFERFTPSFTPDSDLTPSFRRFLRSTGQSGDTGIRLAYTLWLEDLSWGKLRRTNVVDMHYLIGGIYGDVVFHLGAGARSTLFRKDLKRSVIHRLTMPIERSRPRTDMTIRMKRRLLALTRSRAERRAINRNEEVASRVRSWLIKDSDGLFSYLRGTAKDPAPRPDCGPSTDASDDQAGREALDPRLS